MHAPRNTHRPHNHTAYTRYSYSCGHQSPSHTHTTDRHASTPTNSSLNGVHRRDDAALHSIIRSWALQLARHTRWSRRQAPHLAAALHAQHLRRLRLLRRMAALARCAFWIVRMAGCLVGHLTSFDRNLSPRAMLLAPRSCRYRYRQPRRL